LSSAQYYKSHKKEVAAICKQYHEVHKEQIVAYQKQWQKTHKEQKAATDKQYRETHKEQRNLRQKERKLTDINYKMSCDIRRRMSIAVHGGFKAGSAVRDCGCSMDFLRQYLESKFDLTMTWDNYGKYGWHIDHITPLVAFNLANREQFLTAVHYTNLQPLWWTENLSKGASF
jgi:hypothetical protein